MVPEHSTHEKAVQDAISNWLVFSEQAFETLTRHPGASIMQNARSLPRIFVNSLEQISKASSAFTNDAWIAQRDKWDISSVGHKLQNTCEFSSDLLNELCTSYVNKIRGSGKAHQTFCEELSKARSVNDVGLALSDYLNKAQALEQQNTGQLLLLFSGVGPALQQLMQAWVGDLQHDVAAGSAPPTQ
jgi:hypothetical protein